MSTAYKEGKIWQPEQYQSQNSRFFSMHFPQDKCQPNSIFQHLQLLPHSLSSQTSWDIWEYFWQIQRGSHCISTYIIIKGCLCHLGKKSKFINSSNNNKMLVVIVHHVCKVFYIWSQTPWAGPSCVFFLQKIELNN